jgi:myosin-crossreactive antigen
MVTEATPKTLSQKAMFDKGKAAADFANAIRQKGFFFNALMPCFAIADGSLPGAFGMRSGIGVSSCSESVKQHFEIFWRVFHKNCSLAMDLGANLHLFQGRVSARWVLETTFF